MRDWENIKCEIERLKFKKENLQEWKMVEKVNAIIFNILRYSTYNCSLIVLKSERVSA